MFNIYRPPNLYAWNQTWSRSLILSKWCMIESPEKLDPAEKFGKRLERGVDADWHDCPLDPDTVLTRRPCFLCGMSILAETSGASEPVACCSAFGEEFGEDWADSSLSNLWLRLFFRFRKEGTLRTPFTMIDFLENLDYTLLFIYFRFFHFTLMSERWMLSSSLLGLAQLYEYWQ